ncbi:hypothetical protein [Chitinophaga sp.]|uniref:hypothetical protein n=1 Tax=Chitinophaga sp. TaxID=1869181 RepID=UPI0031DB448D
MKNIYQLEPLSEQELISTNGGGLLDGLGGLGLGSTGSSVDYTGYTYAMGTSYIATNSGFASYMAALGLGTTYFLSQLKFPTS